MEPYLKIPLLRMKLSEQNIINYNTPNHHSHLKMHKLKHRDGEILPWKATAFALHSASAAPSLTVLQNHPGIGPCTPEETDYLLLCTPQHTPPVT